jgi:hypothetical protein
MLDRSPAHAFAGRAAADDTGSATVQNDGLALAASMASGPRTRAAVSIHIALEVRVDIPAAVVDSLFAAELAVPVVVPTDIFAVVPIDIPPAGVPVESAVALQTGLTFVPDGLVATGWDLDGGEAAQSSDYDGPEREMAPLPSPALR